MKDTRQSTYSNIGDIQAKHGVNIMNGKKIIALIHMEIRPSMISKFRVSKSKHDEDR